MWPPGAGMGAGGSLHCCMMQAGQLRSIIQVLDEAGRAASA